MPRNRNGTNLTQVEMKRAVWFDIEKREGDVEPAVSGILIENDIEIVVHDSRLKLGAEYSNLITEEASIFYEQLIQKSIDENRLMISYSLADYNYVVNAYPHLKEKLDTVYQKALFTSFFRNQRPDLFASVQSSLKQAKQKKKKRIKDKKNGEFRVGLKDFLKLDEVGYPGRKKAGIGGSASAIDLMRKRLEKSGFDLDALTKGEKKKWTKMQTYLKHDLWGLEHLTKWVNSTNSLKD